MNNEALPNDKSKNVKFTYNKERRMCKMVVTDPESLFPLIVNVKGVGTRTVGN